MQSKAAELEFDFEIIEKLAYKAASNLIAGDRKQVLFVDGGGNLHLRLSTESVKGCIALAQAWNLKTGVRCESLSALMSTESAACQIWDHVIKSELSKGKLSP